MKLVRPRTLTSTRAAYDMTSLVLMGFLHRARLHKYESKQICNGIQLSLKITVVVKKFWNFQIPVIKCEQTETLDTLKKFLKLS